MDPVSIIGAIATLVPVLVGAVVAIVRELRIGASAQAAHAQLHAERLLDLRDEVRGLRADLTGRAAGVDSRPRRA